MTRNRQNILYPLNHNIERTYKRLNKLIEDCHLILYTTSSSSDSEHLEPESMAVNRERTLKELANQDVAINHYAFRCQSCMREILTMNSNHD